MVSEHQVGEAAVIAEGGPASHEALFKPRLPNALQDGAPVAGQRSGQTGHRIKAALRRLENPEGHRITNGLHPGQNPRMDIGHVRTPADPADLLVAKRLHDLSDRVRCHEAV